MVRPQRISTYTTSTGVAGTVKFGTGLSAAVAHIDNPSTKPLDWHMEGGVGPSTQFFALNAATTTTGTAIVNSTASGTFDKVRIVLAGNDWTSTMSAKSFEWWVLGR